MAASAVEPLPQYPMFHKAMTAIQRCGGVAKQKLLLEYDESEVAVKMRIIVEEVWVPVLPVEQKKPKKKNSRKKSKGQERKNHHAVPKNKRDQAVPEGESIQPAGIRIPLPPPPSEYIVNAWLMYFKALDHKVRGAIDSDIIDFIRGNMQTPHVQMCWKRISKEVRKPSGTEISPLSWLCASVIEGLLMLDDIRHNLASLLGAMEKLYYEQEVFDASVEQNPLLQDILECANMLQALIERLEGDQIPEILKGTVKPSLNHYLASILGLDERLVEYLATCDNYLTRKQWILRFIESNQDLQHEHLELDTPTWEDQFQSLGFTTFKAAALSDLVRNNPMSAHLTSKQWAKKYIELQFKYNILLAGSRDFPHLDIIDVDWEFKSDVDDDEEPVYINAITKFRLNEKKLIEDPYFWDYRVQLKQPIESVKYWFHATDTDAAISICRQGISVDQGGKKLDFSDGAGFYLTSSLTLANQWSQRLHRARKFGPAIIVFKLESDVAGWFSNSNGEQFLDDSDEWRNAVKFFRNGKNREKDGVKFITKQRAEQLSDYDYIFGPIAFDGGLRENPTAQPNPEDTVNYQLCIKTQSSAKKFFNNGLNVERVIFFRD